MGSGGETFVLDMGEPVPIVQLAKDLIHLSGLEVDRDISIVFTGLRPGEKMYEELFTSGENVVRTKHEKIFVARNGQPDVTQRAWINDLIAAAEAGDSLRTRHLLSEIVPRHPEAGPGPAVPTRIPADASIDRRDGGREGRSVKEERLPSLGSP